MAITIKFDVNHNPIPPTLILAERNGNKLGLIGDVIGLSIADNLASASEFQFTLYKETDGTANPIWNDIKDFKLIWVKEWDKWFEIYVEINESDHTEKTVTATSLCEAELSNINLYGIEINTEDDIARDDYKNPTVFYNPDDTSASLLHRMMQKIPHYSIEHVDDSLKDIQRTFSFNDESIYDAFQEVAEELECIFIFNSGNDSNGKISRGISVYDLNDCCGNCGYRGTISTYCPECNSSSIISGYGENSMVYIDSECLGDNMQLTTDTDSVKNCFKLEAGDDLMTATVVNCNPNGSSYLWYINDETRACMSSKLQTKLAEYDKTAASFDNFTDDNIDRFNELLAKYTKIDTSLELSAISSPIKSFSGLTKAYYNTIDFQMYLQSELMPSVSIDNPTTLFQQVQLLEEWNGDWIVSTLSDVSSMTNSTAKSNVLSVAKTIITQAYYNVKIEDGSSFDKTTGIWKGSFTVSSIVEDEDDDGYEAPRTTSIISIQLTNDYSKYIKQRIEKLIADDEDTDKDYLIKLFESSLSDFENSLTRYSLDELSSLQKECQSILDVLIALGIGSKTDSTSTATKKYINFNTEDCYEIYNSYYVKMGSIETEISAREEEIAIITNLQEVISSKRTEIQNSLNIESFLGTDLWKELSSYRREQTYSNSNFISDGLNNDEIFARAIEFIELAQTEIYKAATPQHSISTDLKNLFVYKEFKPLLDNFTVGNWIHIRIDGELYKLRLTKYEIDYDDLENVSVEFSDVITVFGEVSDVKSILNKMSSMSKSYDYVTYQAAKTKVNTTMISGWVNDGLDATNVMIANSLENQSVVFDEHGILCRQYDDITENYSPKQVKIINKGLYFTDDNWASVKTGVGSFVYYNPKTGEYEDGYGVIADTIVANIILSEQVGIYNTSNSMTMDANGLTITANGDTINNASLLTLQTVSTGSDGEPVYNKLLDFDKAGNLIINGSSVSIKNTSLNDDIKNMLNYNYIKCGDFENLVADDWSSNDTKQYTMYGGAKYWYYNKYVHSPSLQTVPHDNTIMNYADSEDIQALRLEVVYNDENSIKQNGVFYQDVYLTNGDYEFNFYIACTEPGSTAMTVKIYDTSSQSDSPLNDKITLSNTFGKRSFSCEIETAGTYRIEFSISHDVNTNDNYHIYTYIKYVELVQTLSNMTISTSSSLTMTTNAIIASVLSTNSDGSTKGTTFKLTSDAVRVAWNDVSSYVSLENGGLFVKNSSNGDDLVQLDGGGLKVYNGAIEVYDASDTTKKIFYTDGETKQTTFSGDLLVYLGARENSHELLKDAKTYLSVQGYTSSSNLAGFKITSELNTHSYDIVNITQKGDDGRISFYSLFTEEQELFNEDGSRVLDADGNYKKGAVLCHNEGGRIYSNNVVAYGDSSFYSAYGIGLVIESAPTLSGNKHGGHIMLTAGSGDVWFNIDGYSGGAVRSSTSILQPSDIRLKTNIINMDEKKSADIVNQLTPVQYNMRNSTNQTYYGLIAQDVETILTDNGIDCTNLAIIDKPSENNKYYSLSYTEFIPLLINAIKYQQKQIEELKGVINESN